MINLVDWRRRVPEEVPPRHRHLDRGLPGGGAVRHHPLPLVEVERQVERLARVVALVAEVQQHGARQAGGAAGRGKI